VGEPGYLTGDTEWLDPAPQSYAMGSREEAVVCVDELGDAWEATPGALTWLCHPRSLWKAPEASPALITGVVATAPPCAGRDAPQVTAFTTRRRTGRREDRARDRIYRDLAPRRSASNNSPLRRVKAV
jgi:hypothetical protein